MVATSALMNYSLKRNTGSRVLLFGTHTFDRALSSLELLIGICSCTPMQVYDLAWSPTGEYIISGSTDNVARIFLVSEGNHIQFG
jgi:WD40 repeat protein